MKLFYKRISYLTASDMAVIRNCLERVEYSPEYSFRDIAISPYEDNIMYTYDSDEGSRLYNKETGDMTYVSREEMKKLIISQLYKNRGKMMFIHSCNLF